MIESHEEQIHRESMLMPLFFTSYDNCIRSLKYFQEGLSWMDGLKTFRNPTKYGQFLFCEAIKVDIANSKETSFSNTISSTFSLITVVFEDLFEAINIHKDCCDEKQNPQPSISSLNETDTFDGYDFINDFISDVEYNAIQKELLMLFGGYCIFGYWDFYKNLLCILVEVNKTIYRNNDDVPDKLMDIFLLRSPGLINHMIWQVGATDPVITQSDQTILNKQEFIIHNSMT
jgi:hypothetical protein